jgi:hypothetical protein
MMCPFADILGIPEKGFHEARIGDFALNDTIGTIGLAVVTSVVFDIEWKKSLVYWFVGGEILHYAFGVETAFIKKLGIDVSCY